MAKSRSKQRRKKTSSMGLMAILSGTLLGGFFEKKGPPPKTKKQIEALDRAAEDRGARRDQLRAERAGKPVTKGKR